LHWLDRQWVVYRCNRKICLNKAGGPVDLEVLKDYIQVTTHVLTRHKTGQGVLLGEFGLASQSRALANTNHQAVKLQHRLKVVCIC
jgi:hypothetical protein